MPSSSSASKVARVAARSGGSAAGAKAAKQRNWLFALAIVAIVAIGGTLVVFARQTNVARSKNNTHPLANLNDGSAFDHWHAAFALNVCGKELPAIAQPPDDPYGIHTHGDGLIHIHPFTVNVSGKRAKMKVFWDLVNLKVNNEGFQDPATGKVYEEGKTTCGGKPTQLVMAFWKKGATAASQEPDKIFTSDFANVNYTDPLSAYTLALLPVGAKVPAPSSAAEIQTLGAADGGTTATNAPKKDDTTGSSTATTPATTAPKKGSG